jgi:hypothetical protein
MCSGPSRYPDPLWNETFADILPVQFMVKFCMYGCNKPVTCSATPTSPWWTSPTGADSDIDPACTSSFDVDSDRLPTNFEGRTLRKPNFRFYFHEREGMAFLTRKRLNTYSKTLALDVI